jgi:hypothetical protein
MKEPIYMGIGNIPRTPFFNKPIIRVGKITILEEDVEIYSKCKNEKECKIKKLINFDKYNYFYEEIIAILDRLVKFKEDREMSNLSAFKKLNL